MARFRRSIVSCSSKKTLKSVEVVAKGKTNMMFDDSFHSFSPIEEEEFRKNILNWYDKNKRDLPWRKIKAKEINERAYAVWVSEIMLQQTQVATVISYYNKWMKKWPTLQALASSNIEEVNEAWSGLGYYSRGRRLFEGAKKVVEELDGQMPKSAIDLEKQLPGVGRYTAGAIASIALGQRTGVVDGNVIRVLSRMRMIGGNTTSPDVLERIWTLAHSLVEEAHPGDFNQAMMELGATVCTPKTPSCDSCPVKSFCRAKAKTQRDKTEASSRLCTTNNNNGQKPLVDIECLVPDCKLCLPTDQPWEKELGVLNFPRKPKKSKAREENLDVVLLCQKEGKHKYLVCQRPEKGLLAGLWEFLVLPPTDTDQTPIGRLCEVLGVDESHLKALQQIGEVSHQFSHVHHQYTVWTATSDGLDSEVVMDRPTKWLTEQQLGEAAMSTGMRKVFKVYKGSMNASNPSVKRKKPLDEDVILREPKKAQKSISDFFKQKS